MLIEHMLDPFAHCTILPPMPVRLISLWDCENLINASSEQPLSDNTTVLFACGGTTIRLVMAGFLTRVDEEEE